MRVELHNKRGDQKRSEQEKEGGAETNHSRQRRPVFLVRRERLSRRSIDPRRESQVLCALVRRRRSHSGFQRRKERRSIWLGTD